MALPQMIKDDGSYDKATLLGGCVQLMQPRKGFRAGTDTVLLAAFAPIKAGQSIADLGAGVGGAGLCVLARVPELKSIYAIEIQGDYAALARHNAEINGHDEQRYQVMNADMRDISKDASLRGQMDHVICNPPYLGLNQHLSSPDPGKATAMGQHAQDQASLQDWVKAAHRLLKPGGSLTLVHRGHDAAQIISDMHGKFGAIEILPVLSKASSESAKRVLVRGYKDRRSPSKIINPIIMHEENGDYTKAAHAVLKDLHSLR
jgi:tRNA1(Val) A37 N6-methylase TrmN6